MSSLGGFCEGKINGKSFLIFNLLNQPDNLSSFSSSETTTVSGGNTDLLQPLFICPILRLNALVLKLSENVRSGDTKETSCIPIGVSPHFPSSEQQVQYLLNSDGNINSGSYNDSDDCESSNNDDIDSSNNDDIDSNNNDDIDSSNSDLSYDDYEKKVVAKICKLPVVPLFWCNNQESVYTRYRCRLCGNPSDRGTDYYFCVTCDEKFHKECVESPSEIKHPFYPFLSFQLSHSRGECVSCKTRITAMGYHCPTSKLSMHPVCALKPIPFVLDHPKRHPHPLTFFPKQAFLPCNVCGLIIQTIPTYLCVPCVSVAHQFVVHQDCVDSPTVIKISRHHHRISFISSPPSGKWFCGVCRKEVDNNYGAYSCNKGEDYYVHTRCALRRDLWDGKELEGVPEEDEIIVPPFERIADGIIRHFLHDHLLKLEINRVDQEDKFCSACVLPINLEDEFYSCVDQCDFILHEECANAPRRTHHPLHAHPLTLKVVTNQYDNNMGYFECEACLRTSCGFVYESDEGGKLGFRLDLRCALVSEPFKYQGHKQPLFLALTPEEEKAAICQICESSYIERKLNCIVCDFVICFECATLPYKGMYKHDKHLLTFQKEKEASGNSGWCELCEKKLVYSRKGGFYSCDECCTTLHVDCLLGKNTYMRPGQTIKGGRGDEIQIVSNDTMSRPYCEGRLDTNCGNDRCPFRVVFKNNNRTYCSFDCAA